MVQGEQDRFRRPAGARAAPGNSVFPLPNSKKWRAALQRLSLAVALLAVGFSTSAYSQGRTIEETLVVSDPTVAAQGKWKIGGAGEYWYVNQSYKLVDQNGNES